MNKLRKHLTIDALILVIASFMLVISLVLFFADGYFFGNDSYANLIPVGKFDLAKNDVRRRVDSGLTWNNVSSPEIVYEGDSVFTGDDSEASVALSNGALIKIDPKSLVVIRTRGNNTEIDLQYGSLQGKVGGAQGLILTQNGKSEELSSQGAEVRIVRAQRSQETKVQVVKGEVKVSSGDKPEDKETIEQDEVAEFKPAAQPVVKKAPVTLLSPENGETRWVTTGTSVPFKWKASGNSTEHRFEVSRDSSFATPSFKSEVNGTTYELAETSRPEGTFYWRVTPKVGEPSMPSRLNIYPDVAPLPVTPTEGQTYWIENAADKTKVVYFTWDDKAGSTSWKLQVAHDEQFKDIVYEHQGKTTSERAALPPGQYIYRVLGEHQMRKNPPWSRLVAFSVKSGAKGPKIPVLENERISYEIPRSALKGVTEKDVQAGRGVKPEGLKPFAWTPVEGASLYEVEISQSEDFKNGVKQTVQEPKFAPQEVKPGSLFMRVRAKGESGRMSAVSEPARLDVTLPAPDLAKIDAEKKVFKTQKDLDAASHDFKLAWTPVPYASSYELQWGADPEFSKSKKFNVKETKRTIPVHRAMDYSARVRALGRDGQPLSPYSQTKTASYKKELFVPPLAVAKPKPKPAPTPVAVVAPTPQPRAPAALKAKSTDDVGGLIAGLAAPLLREPRPQTSLISLENAPTFVSFRWNPYKDASYYTIQISTDADFTKIIEQKKVLKTAFVYEKPLPEGKVFWRVRVHTKLGYSTWSDPADLNVLYQ